MHYAFIVGNNAEWPEQRCTRGDIGLARCLSGLGLPKENFVELYDERATRSNVLTSLERLLDRRNTELSNRNTTAQEPDSLLFYYGGHGKRKEFCTHKGNKNNEPWIKHSEIVDILENKFQGGTVWILLDTCHSGGFGEALAHRQKRRQRNKNGKLLNARYGCILASAPEEIAGMEWTLSECFIRVFKGEILCSDNNSSSSREPYYLSTKNKGKHAIQSGVPDRIDHQHATTKDCKSVPSWEQVIEFLTDERVRINGNRMTTLFIGEDMEDGTLLRKPCTFGGDGGGATNLSTSVNNTACIQRDDTWMEPFRRNSDGKPFSKEGDVVYVKSVGQSTIGDGQYRIGWFLGRILSIMQIHGVSANNGTNGDSKDMPSSTNSEACVELYDVITKSHWKAMVPICSADGRNNNILGGFPFGIGNPQPCVNIVTRLAKHLAYVDTTLPPRIKVKAPWSDGKCYSAVTLYHTEIPWSEICREESQPESAGPCVPVRWKGDGSVSFIPSRLCKVVCADGDEGSVSLLSETSTRDPAELILTPLDAMMASLACGGKKLQGKTPILNNNNDTEEDSIDWEAWDAEDCEWSKVQLMNKMDLSIIPLKVLAYHMCYHESGTFSLVYWESDSTLNLIPTSCLRQRQSSADNVDDCDDDSTRPDSDDYEGDVKRYTQNIVDDAGNNT